MIIKKRHWFQYVAAGVLTLFFGIMTFVTYIAFTRTPGSTGMDMSKIQKTRYDHQYNLSKTAEEEVALSKGPKNP
jgi:hypothetical protein